MILFSLTTVGIFGRIGHYLLSLVLRVEFAKNETRNSWLLHAMLMCQLLLLSLVSIEWFYSKPWENWFWHWYFLMHRNLVTIASGRCQQPVEWELSETSSLTGKLSMLPPNFTNFFTVVLRSLISFRCHVQQVQISPSKLVLYCCIKKNHPNISILKEHLWSHSFCGSGL